MAKITITGFLGSFLSVIGINNRFNQVEDELNDKVLYRDNPVGEPNEMNNDLDMNGNDLLNVNQLTTVDGQFLKSSDDATITGQWDFDIPPNGAVNPDEDQAINANWGFAGDLQKDGSDVITQNDSADWVRSLVGQNAAEVSDDGQGNYIVSVSGTGGDVLAAGNNVLTGNNTFRDGENAFESSLVHKSQDSDPSRVRINPRVVRTDVSTYNLGGYDKIQFFADTDVAGQSPYDDPEDVFSIYYNCNWNDGRIVGYSGIGGVKAISGVTSLASGPRSETRNQGEGGFLFASSNTIIPNLTITTPNYTDSILAGNFPAEMGMFPANYWSNDAGTLGLGQPTWRVETLNSTGSSLPNAVFSGICSDGANLYLGGWSGDDRARGGGEDCRGTRNIVFGVHTNKNAFTTNVNEFNGDLQEGTLTYIRGQGMCYVDENRALRRVRDNAVI